MKKRIYLLLILSFIFPVWAFAQNNADSALEAKYREFDFWIGDWEVYKFETDTLVGKSKIESILNGKVIKESYESVPSPYKGTSLNKYNAQKKKWEQFWVDNSGLTLHIEGGIQKEKMVMETFEALENGTTGNRISWTPLPEGRVRQVWEVSPDQGKTWQKVFDGEYRPKKN